MRQTSTAFSVALLFLFFMPGWIFVLWLARSSALPRWIAERSPLRWIALAGLSVGILAASFGARWVHLQVLDAAADASAHQLVTNATIVEVLVWAAAIVAIAARRRRAGAKPALRDHPLSGVRK